MTLSHSFTVRYCKVQLLMLMVSQKRKKSCLTESGCALPGTAWLKLVLRITAQYPTEKLCSRSSPRWTTIADEAALLYWKWVSDKNMPITKAYIYFGSQQEWHLLELSETVRNSISSLWGDRKGSGCNNLAQFCWNGLLFKLDISGIIWINTKTCFIGNKKPQKKMLTFNSFNSF